MDGVTPPCGAAAGARPSLGRTPSARWHLGLPSAAPSRLRPPGATGPGSPGRCRPLPARALPGPCWPPRPPGSRWGSGPRRCERSSPPDRVARRSARGADRCRPGARPPGSRQAPPAPPGSGCPGCCRARCRPPSTRPPGHRCQLGPKSAHLLGPKDSHLGHGIVSPGSGEGGGPERREGVARHDPGLDRSDRAETKRKAPVLVRPRETCAGYVWRHALAETHHGQLHLSAEAPQWVRELTRGITTSRRTHSIA